ncbi:Protein DegV [subsurface metagenome]
MNVKVVTDSTADLPPETVKELGITVVPLYILFGHDKFRDRVDISEDDFYDRLVKDPAHPTTTQPTPKDFTDCYQKLSKKATAIVSIHISEKLSGTCNSAIHGAKQVKDGCPVEVIDSRTVSMALGLAVKAAAVMAKEGKGLKNIVAEVNRIINELDIMVIFDSLKYLAKGGRIGKAKALMGSLLNVKPVLKMKDGVFEPSGRVRNRAKGVQKLVNYAREAGEVKELAVIHSTTPEEAGALGLKIKPLLPGVEITIARLGPVLGVHGGPGVLAVALRGKPA